MEVWIIIFAIIIIIALLSFTIQSNKISMKYTAVLAFAAPLLSSVTASPVDLEARQNVRRFPNPSITASY